ncbi:MAG: hypothetical protein CMF74_05500 [Maricaulis sp.]|nr:hypothetical protein [Maricaulis sp.]
MTGQCSVMPMARVSGAASGTAEITTKCSGHRKLMVTIDHIAAPETGDFTPMNLALSGYCRTRPRGKIRPDNIAAVSPQSATASVAASTPSTVQYTAPATGRDIPPLAATK